MIRPKKQVRAELYIAGDRAKILLELLKQKRDDVERALGYPLDWEELPSRRDCRISAYMHNADPEDESDWPRQHQWLSDKLNDLHRVFASRVAIIDLDQSVGEFER